MAYPNWFARHADTLRLILPSYALLHISIAITAFIYGPDFAFGTICDR